MILRQLRAAASSLKPHHVGEAGWVFLGQMGTTLGSLFGLKLLTQILPPEIYGRVNLMETAMILPVWLLFSPVLQAAVRLYAPSQEAGRLPQLLRTVLFLYLTASGVVVAGGLLLIRSGLFAGKNYPPWTLCLALLVLLSGTWQGLGNGVCHAARLRGRSAALSTLSTWGRPLLASALVLRFGASLGPVLSGFLAASLLTLPFLFGPVRGALRTRTEQAPWMHREVLDKLIPYAKPYAAWGVFSWGQMYVDRFALQLALGAAAVGPYAVAVQIATLPFNLAAAYLIQLATPVVFQRAGDGLEPLRLASSQAVVRWTSVAFAGLGVIAAAVYALVGGSVMQALTRADYVIPRSVLVVLAMGALAQNLAQLLATSLLAHNRTDVLLWAMVIPGVLSAPLSFLWVRQAGMLGAAYSTATTSFIFLALVWWTLQVVIPKNQRLAQAGIK